MGIWKLKGCPRCGGDLFLESDEYDWFETCLQCSFRQELKKVNEPSESEAEEKFALVGRPQHRRRQ
jgi:hypothetical protein